MWHLNKIPKTVHFYWGGEKLSYLRFLSVQTFCKLNPDWQVLIHTPKTLSMARPQWDSFQQKNSQVQQDYFDQLALLPVTIVQHDFARYKFDNQAHEVHKSDFLRWKLLSKQGGVWSDIDILYVQPMHQLLENCAEFSNVDTALCPLLPPGKHTIGFLMSSPGNNFFQSIGRRARSAYDPESYQCMGSNLINQRFRSLNQFQRQFKQNNFVFLDKACVYSIDSKSIEKFFQVPDQDIMKKLNNKKVIGFHWFAGHPLSQEFENILTADNVDQHNNILTTAIRNFTNEA
jgi:hypothetical protein